MTSPSEPVSEPVGDPSTGSGNGAGRESKPIVLTVDDDPSVSRAIARDLRCRYAVPLTEWLPSTIRRDSDGFVLTGPDLLIGGSVGEGWELDRDPYLLESSLPGVFVAGDVRAQSVKRVASAVGEGALAVTLVHRYLAEQ